MTSGMAAPPAGDRHQDCKVIKVRIILSFTHNVSDNVFYASQDRRLKQK